MRGIAGFLISHPGDPQSAYPDRNLWILYHESGQEDGTDRLWNLLNPQIWRGLFLLGTQNEWHSREAALAPA